MPKEGGLKTENHQNDDSGVRGRSTPTEVGRVAGALATVSGGTVPPPARIPGSSKRESSWIPAGVYPRECGGGNDKLWICG